MHGPDGTDFPNEKKFLEVVPMERVVFEHLQTFHQFVMTIYFVENPGQTDLVWKMLFDSPDAIAKIRGLMLEADEQNFDHPVTYLAMM